jgi:hypothetical protein
MGGPCSQDGLVFAMIGLAYSFLMKWFGAVDHRRDRGPSGKSQGTSGRPDSVNTLNVATSVGKIRSSRSQLNPWSSRRAKGSNSPR